MGCNLCMCVFSVLMLVFLSRYEPADTVCPQDGVQSEACDEEDREDQEPVDGLHWDAGKGAKTVCVHHFSVGGSIKPWNGLQQNAGSCWNTVVLLV